jgi:hypothetical protein
MVQYITKHVVNSMIIIWFLGIGVCVMISAAFLIAALLYQWRSIQTRAITSTPESSSRGAIDEETVRRHLQDFNARSGAGLIGPDTRGVKDPAVAVEDLPN